MVTQTDLKLGDGRTLHSYDTGSGNVAGRLAVFWHHGSPNIGAPPEPLFSAADRLGIRWVSYDRPGYGGSRPCPDRDAACAGASAPPGGGAFGFERDAGGCVFCGGSRHLRRWGVSPGGALWVGGGGG